MNWKFLSRKKTDATKPKKSKTREWLDAILFALVASTIIRGLLFSAFAIPSASMEGSLMTGDYLFVSKLSYGARMPMTPISIPFLESTIWGGTKTYWDGIQLPYYRLPGLGDVKKATRLYLTILPKAFPARWICGCIILNAALVYPAKP
jgi:signal peptidase I